MTGKLSLLMIAAVLTLSLAACQATQEEQDASTDTAQTNEAGTAAQNLPTSSHPDTEDWQPLFTSDLSNAELQEPNSWVMEDGILKAQDHSTLWTQSSYEDFVLDLEFNTPEGANSGVFLRPEDTDNILSALEIQIHDSTDGGRHGEVGAVYDLKSPSKDVDKPAGEWERFTITANDNKIYVVHNGEQVIDMDLNRWTEPNQNPDGTENKFDRAIRDQAGSGPIGLQGIHGGGGQPVLFRNVKIKRLDP